VDWQKNMDDEVQRWTGNDRRLDKRPPNTQEEPSQKPITLYKFAERCFEMIKRPLISHGTPGRDQLRHLLSYLLSPVPSPIREYIKALIFLGSHNFYECAQDWVLRNMATKEYVRNLAVSTGNRSPFSPQGSIGLRDVLLVRIC
jgi:hypothetical protein